MSSTKGLHTYTETKFYPRTNKIQSKTTMLILRQSRNTALSIKRQAFQSHAKPMDTPKLTTGHFIALQREEIQLHPPEHKHKLPQPENLDKLLVQSHLTRSRLQNKEEPWTSSLQKGHSKHSNLNKMKRQRKIQQIKEHDKCPPNQTEEEEIGSLLEKEFRIMILKMIQNLKNKMELQINSLETRIEKMQKNV